MGECSKETEKTLTSKGEKRKLPLKALKERAAETLQSETRRPV